MRLENLINKNNYDVKNSDLQLQQTRLKQIKPKKIFVADLPDLVDKKKYHIKLTLTFSANGVF